MILAVFGLKSRDKIANGIAIAAQITTATNAAQRAETTTARSATSFVIDEFSQLVRLITVRYSPMMIPPSRVSLAKIVITAKSSNACGILVIIDRYLQVYLITGHVWFVFHVRSGIFHLLSLVNAVLSRLLYLLFPLQL
mmetsp:Transcript_117964/g.241166  ORF Transcript_117964/g.241166 Transcript_117964/m.241166 type:complete len:139 (-) Transcript_117964:174-590(-)